MFSFGGTRSKMPESVQSLTSRRRVCALLQLVVDPAQRIGVVLEKKPDLLGTAASCHCLQCIID